MYANPHLGPACCSTCKYFRPMDASEVEGDDEPGEETKDGDFGRCCRRPPTFYYPGILNAEFPVVKHDAWCGEHARTSSL